MCGARRSFARTCVAAVGSGPTGWRSGKSALTLTAGFGLVALGLATLGIYRVLSEQRDWTKRE
jgi:predicted RNA methylase